MTLVPVGLPDGERTLTGLQVKNDPRPSMCVAKVPPVSS